MRMILMGQLSSQEHFECALRVNPLLTFKKIAHVVTLLFWGSAFMKNSYTVGSFVGFASIPTMERN